MLGTISAVADRAPVPLALLDDHCLLRTLHGGLRSEVWLGLAEGAALLDHTPFERVVVVKKFFPHLPGPALEGLLQELELARRLQHENITRHWRITAEPEQPLVISEYLEGMPLSSLLLRASAAGIALAPASVARVLAGIVAAVLHAESQVASSFEKGLIQQLVAVDDVFITFDGSVKLLGFKSRLRAIQWHEPEASGITSSAAIDALLEGHQSAGLRTVLRAAHDTSVRCVDGLWQVGQTLQRWQTQELGSDGRVELAASMQQLFSAARLQRAAQLASVLAKAAVESDAALDEVSPVSEIRSVSSRRQSRPPRELLRVAGSKK